MKLERALAWALTMVGVLLLLAMVVDGCRRTMGSRVAVRDDGAVVVPP